jgi:branched-chain amino acid transport system permease protein
MRFITEKKVVAKHNEAHLTIGLLAVFDGLSNFAFGDEPSGFPSLFSTETVALGGLNVSIQAIGIIAVSWIGIGLVFLFFRFSNVGLKMEAVAENMMAARIRGIRASNILAFAWGLATCLSVCAGILIAPVVFAYPLMFSNIFSYSLIAVVIGGLESPFGAVVSGVLIGIVENIGSQFEFIGSELKIAVVFILLIVVLIIRPTGIWGKSEGRKI